MNRERAAAWVTQILEQVERARRVGRAYALPVPWAEALAADLGELMHDLRPVATGCAVCGAPLQQKSRGAPRKYCPRPARCRDKAARKAV